LNRYRTKYRFVNTRDVTASVIKGFDRRRPEGDGDERASWPKKIFCGTNSSRNNCAEGCRKDRTRRRRRTTQRCSFSCVVYCKKELPLGKRP